MHKKTFKKIFKIKKIKITYLLISFNGKLTTGLHPIILMLNNLIPNNKFIENRQHFPAPV